MTLLSLHKDWDSGRDGFDDYVKKVKEATQTASSEESTNLHTDFNICLDRTQLSDSERHAE
jgi:hypothetical protein